VCHFEQIQSLWSEIVDSAVSSVRELLSWAGYEVVTADNGLDALLQLKRSVPEVIISVLNMPKMSRFECLSVVRQLFPQISVIASSGSYSKQAVPAGVIADMFFTNGQDTPGTLLTSVADLIRTAEARAIAHRREAS